MPGDPVLDHAGTTFLPSIANGKAFSITQTMIERTHCKEGDIIYAQSIGVWFRDVPDRIACDGAGGHWQRQRCRAA
jgi:hypothetical protein